MRHGSLFSGIGGFDLAAEWMGWDNVFHCEWNEFGQKVLKHHFPNADSYSDITKTDFRKYANTIDILTGGFPCQPFSLAGKRKGTDDERYLWHEMLRAIQEIKPRFVIAENVFGIVNIDGGLVFEQVCADLENEGYEVQPFIIPACAKDAPHRRDRVWFVASNTKSWRLERQGKVTSSERIERERRTICTYERIGCNVSSNTNSIGQTKRCEQPITDTERQLRFISNKHYWKNWPTQSPICSGDDGLSTKLDGITLPKWRNESIKAFGNAIVPQVAFTIFNALCTTSSQL